MPESVPGPYRLSSASGSGSTGLGVVAELAEVRDRRALVPELLELLGGQAADLERRVGDDGDAVVGDLELLVGDAVLLAERDLLLLDRPRGVGDVGLAGAELLEAAAGAGLPDVDADVGVLLVEQLAGAPA